MQFLSVISAMANAVSCAKAPVCATLNRLPCTQTPDTCGGCFNSDYIGDSGDANTPCFLPPSLRPTAAPTRQPTGRPSHRPSSRPSRQPTRQPTQHPTITRTFAPSATPTLAPTNASRRLSEEEEDPTSSSSLASSLSHHGIHLLAATGGGSGGSGGGSIGSITSPSPSGFCNATVPCNVALFQSCVNSVCTVLSKTCFNNCGAPTAAAAKPSTNASYGQCVYLSVETASQLSDCKQGTTSCYATCICAHNRGGLGCDLSAQQLVSTSLHLIKHPINTRNKRPLITLSTHSLTTPSRHFSDTRRVNRLYDRSCCKGCSPLPPPRTPRRPTSSRGPPRPTRSPTTTGSSPAPARLWRLAY